VRSLEYSNALGGKNYPQTPCKVAIGVWAAGSSSEAEGTITWAGGLTDFDDAPFTMYVESVKIENYNPGRNYKWTDQTGDNTSIEVLNSTSISNTTSSTGISGSGSSSVADPAGVLSGNSSSTTLIAASGTSIAVAGTASSFAQSNGANQPHSKHCSVARPAALSIGILSFFLL
jgi:hypothetical protein